MWDSVGMGNEYQRFLTVCKCGGKTSRKYAASHNGQCKACATGQPKQNTGRVHLKPGQYWEDDGGEYKMSAEYAHEVRGGNDLSPDCGQSDY